MPEAEEEASTTVGIVVIGYADALDSEVEVVGLGGASFLHVVLALVCVVVVFGDRKKGMGVDAVPSRGLSRDKAAYWMDTTCRPAWKEKA